MAIQNFHFSILDSRERSSCSNSTHIVFVPSHLDIPIQTPGRAPRILHEPIRCLCLFVDTVPNNENSVIQILSTTFGWVVDTCKGKVDKKIILQVLTGLCIDSEYEVSISWWERGGHCFNNLGVGDII